MNLGSISKPQKDSKVCYIAIDFGAKNPIIIYYNLSIFQWAVIDSLRRVSS